MSEQDFFKRIEGHVGSLVKVKIVLAVTGEDIQETIRRLESQVGSLVRINRIPRMRRGRRGRLHGKVGRLVGWRSPAVSLAGVVRPVILVDGEIEDDTSFWLKELEFIGGAE